MVSPESGIDYVGRHQHPSARGARHARALGARRAHHRHRLRLPRLRERGGRGLRRRGGRESPAGARRASRPHERPGLSLGIDPEDDGFGVADGKVLAGDATLSPDDRRSHRRPDARAHAVHARERAARRSSRRSSTSRAIPRASAATTASSPPTSRTPPASGSRPSTVALADLGERRPRRAPGSARHRRPRPGDERGPRRGARSASPRCTGRSSPSAPSPRSPRRRRGPHVAADRASPRRTRWRSRSTTRSSACSSPSACSTRGDSLFTNGVPDDVGRVPVPASVRSDSAGARRGHPHRGGRAAHRHGEASRWCRASSIRRSAPTYRARMRGAEHTFIFGLANDQIGYQVPFAKWDNSCHACAPYVIAGLRRSVPRPADRLRHRVRQQRRPASRSGGDERAQRLARRASLTAR